MRGLITLLPYIVDLLTPSPRFVWAKVFVYLFGIIFLIVGFIIGGWALYIYLLEHMSPLYSLLTLSLTALGLSLILFMTGLNLSEEKKAPTKVPNFVSHAFASIPHGKEVSKFIAKIPKKAFLAVVICGAAAALVVDHYRKES